VVAYRRLKTKENFKVLALKVVAVAYERRSLTSTAKLIWFTFGMLEYWLLRTGGGRLLKVVATGGSTVLQRTKKNPDTISIYFR